MYVNKKNRITVYCLTAWKSPTECMILLSHWVKTPPCGLLRPASCTDRAIHAFLLDQRGFPYLGILYYSMQSMCVLQCWKLFPFYCIVVIVLNSLTHFSPVHWQWSMRTGYVFRRTQVWPAMYQRLLASSSIAEAFFLTKSGVPWIRLSHQSYQWTP